MARRTYVRDNRGRFATVGATARGGRLRTAAGNKRATVTGRLESVKPKGTISKSREVKPAPANPAPVKAEPRQRVRGNFRPRNTMARFTGEDHGLYRDAPRGSRPGSPERKEAVIHNARTMKRQLEQLGGLEVHVSRSNPGYLGAFTITAAGTSRFSINPRAAEMVNPIRSQLAGRRSGFFSTGSAQHTAHHEVGHSVHSRRTDALRTKAGGKRAPISASRVSKYATTDAAEFVAEVYAGRRLGRKYDATVMRDYQRQLGIKPRSLRSQLKRKP